MQQQQRTGYVFHRTLRVHIIKIHAAVPIAVDKALYTGY